MCPCPVHTSNSINQRYYALDADDGVKEVQLVSMRKLVHCVPQQQHQAETTAVSSDTLGDTPAKPNPRITYVQP